MGPLLLTGIFALVALLSLAGILILPGDLVDNGWKFVLMLPCATALLGAIIVPLVIYPSRSVGHTTCRRFHEQSGYPTKFVLLNSWDTGTCLARTRSGSWVPTKQLVGVSR